MAVRTRGLTVNIDGDTTGLTKALSNVNKEVKNTQSQLKDVDKLLKLVPTNTELLSQEQYDALQREITMTARPVRAVWILLSRIWSMTSIQGICQRSLENHGSRWRVYYD